MIPRRRLRVRRAWPPRAAAGWRTDARRVRTSVTLGWRHRRRNTIAASRSAPPAPAAAALRFTLSLNCCFYYTLGRLPPRLAAAPAKRAAAVLPRRFLTEARQAVGRPGLATRFWFDIRHSAEPAAVPSLRGRVDRARIDTWSSRISLISELTERRLFAWAPQRPARAPRSMPLRLPELPRPMPTAKRRDPASVAAAATTPGTVPHTHAETVLRRPGRRHSALGPTAAVPTPAPERNSAAPTLPPAVIVWRERNGEADTLALPGRASSLYATPPQTATVAAPRATSGVAPSATPPQTATVAAPRATGGAPPSATPQRLEPAIAERLVEDVIRRFDRRLRIERERRGH
jgi:hypothetical protein